MALTYTQERLLDRARRAAAKREKGQTMADESLFELRQLWVKARAEGIPSHIIAEASNVSPESVRIQWGRNGKKA